MTETKIQIGKTPKRLYHIVPVSIFNRYTDSKGNYDPRNRKDFGKNLPYVHTTPSIKQMNQHLTYLKQIKDKEFYLLKINVEKLDHPKITAFRIGDRIYHHIWCALDKKSYSKRIVRKNEKSKIIL